MNDVKHGINRDKSYYAGVKNVCELSHVFAISLKITSSVH